MKTFRGILIAGVAGLALFAVENTAAAQPADVDADINETLGLAVSLQMATLWDLDVGVLNNNQANVANHVELTADSNVAYFLRQQCDGHANKVVDARLTEYSGAYPAATAHPDFAGSALQLGTDLQVGLVGSGTQAITTALTTSPLAQQTPGAARVHPVLLEQATTFADVRLDTVGDYHLELTFTISTIP